MKNEGEEKAKVGQQARSAAVIVGIRAVDVAILLGALALPLLTAWQLIANFGWLFGALAAWVVAPVAGGVGAFLVFVWTIPFRDQDVLSVRRSTATVVPPLDAAPGTPGLAISVIVPAYNAVEYLKRSLPPLMDLMKRGEIAEVVVVDDTSTDRTVEFARSLGARVVPSGGRLGPGGARNEAAKHVKGDILWFVDADVVVHADSVWPLRSAFLEPGVVAVFGSYDDKPPAPNFGSQYKNLVHHHYHQHADPRASTFWSGCGAVRRDAFLAIDGFDQSNFKVPSVEDIDLGYRMRAAGGQIRLDRRILSTHLKIWSVPELVKTDIFRRALPWARMMLNRTDVIDDLNVGTAERLRAILAGVGVAAVPAAALGLLPYWALAPILLTAVTANWHLFRLFARARGYGFASAGLAFHQVYYLYSTASFAWCWFEAKLSRRARPAPEPAPAIAS